MKKYSSSKLYRRTPPIIWVILGMVLIGMVILVLNMFIKPQAPTGLVSSEKNVPRISIREAFESVKDGQAILLDTRSLESFQQGHAVGAYSFPLSEVETRLVELDKNRWYITYCT